LTLFLCFGEGGAYGGVRATWTFYQAQGSAGDVAVTRDYDVLVSLSARGTTQQAGIQVFRRAINYGNPCLLQFPPGLIISSVKGLQIFPNSVFQLENVSVGAAVEEQGAEFFRALDLNTCVMGPVVNVPQLPVEAASPGTFALAVTPAGAPEYAFVANEYGDPEGILFGLLRVWPVINV
jgi:hypothetical protein